MVGIEQGASIAGIAGVEQAASIEQATAWLVLSRVLVLRVLSRLLLGWY